MEGKLSIYSLNDITVPGEMPKQALFRICEPFYSLRSISYNRAYAAMSAKQKIDMIVRCYNTALPANAEYVIPEDGNQYRITLKQPYGDSVDLTLERLEEFYDIAE